jgi:hypothetical protein
MELDLSNYTKDKVKVAPKEIEAILINIEQKTAIELYGDTAFDKDKIYLRLTFENEEHNVKQTADFALYDIEELDSRSKLGQYVNKYGDLELKKVVTLRLTTNNFYNVVLD